MSRLFNKKILLFAATGVFFALLAYLNCRFAILNYDDIVLLPQHFPILQHKNGFIRTIIDVFLNNDLGGSEYRTYGLSKVVQFVLFQIGGLYAGFYAFIMITVHLLSAVILYKILKKLFQNYEIAIFIAFIWAINPYTLPQTFHHFSYILLPIYFIFIYTYFNLNYLLDNKLSNKAIYKIVAIGSLLSLASLFSGEASIMILITAMLLFLFFSIKYNKMLTKIYFIQLVVVTCAYILYYLHYKIYLCSVGTKTRFKFGIPSLDQLSSGLIEFKNALIVRINDAIYRATVLSDQNISVAYVVFAVIILLFVCIFWSLSEERYKKRTEFKFVLISLLITSSSFIVLFLLAVTQSCFVIGERYGFVIIPFVISSIVIVVYYVFRQRIAKICCFILMSFLIWHAVVHYTVKLPEMYKAHKKIVNIIELAKNSNKKAVLIINSESLLGVNDNYPNAGILSPYMSSANTPFQSFLFTHYYLKSFCNFEIIAYRFKELDDKRVILYSGTTENKKGVYLKNDILVLSGNGIDISKQYRDDPAAYLDWKDFYNSMSYSGAHISYEQQLDPLLSIDMGGRKDKHYQSMFKEISYGWVSGEDSLSEYSPSIGSSYTSNRHGNFVYKISGLPKVPLKITFDFQEIWQKEINKRLFKIIITTDNRQFTINNIDLFNLGGDKSFSIVMNIEPTEAIRIAFQQEAGSVDIPFVNRIQIFKKRLI